MFQETNDKYNGEQEELAILMIWRSVGKGDLKRLAPHRSVIVTRLARPSKLTFQFREEYLCQSNINKIAGAETPPRRFESRRTVSRVLFLPEDLHQKITTLSAHGKADNLIIECVREAIEPRYRHWLEQELLNAGRPNSLFQCC